MTSDFTKITVVGVTGLQDRAVGTALAVQHTARILSGSRALLVSPEKPAALPSFIHHRTGCPPGYDAYQRFMLFDLADFVDTQYALVVQHDGWALSAENWRPEFLDYDYVGAPGHLARVTSPDGTSRYFRKFRWVDYLGTAGCKIDFVMNGGFSLRTQKLMRAPREYGLPFPPPPPYGNDENLEDVWMSIVARPELTAAGIRFAPLDVARRFSVEHAGALHLNFPMQTIFGHHSRERRIDAIDDRGGTMRYARVRKFYDDLLGEPAIIAVLLRHGWKIQWPDGTCSEPHGSSVIDPAVRTRSK